MSKLRNWYERQDEIEKSSIVAFGIGCPIILIILALVLKLAH